MNIRHKRFARAELAGFLLLASWSGSALGGYYLDDFEGYLEGTKVESMGQGWTASDAGPAVLTLAFTNGLLPNKAMDIPQGAVVSNAVVPAATKVWMDLWLNETNQVIPGGLENPDTNRISMAGITTNGCLVYYNRSLAGGSWDVCTNDVMGTTIVSGQVATGSWGRVTVFQDFSTHTVAFFLNGRLLRQQVPFMSAAINSMSGFHVAVGNDHAALDNVAVTNAIPAGLTGDQDGDGRLDADEIATYGSLSAWGPSTVTASVTNGVGGTVSPVTAASILWQGTTNFTFHASPGYFVDRVWTNGVLVANYSNSMVKTAGFTWSNIVASGTLDVGFWYTGVLYVPGDYTTITGTLAAALTGDRIMVTNGTYAESVVLSNGVSLTVSNCTVTFNSLTIQPGSVVHVVNATVTVNGVTYTSTFDMDSNFGPLTASVTNGVGGTVSPLTASSIIWPWATNFTFHASPGYSVDRVWTNGVLASNYSNAMLRTAGFTWSNIMARGALDVGFWYDGGRYVPGDYATITGALAAALAGDRIIVTNGTYAESVVVSNGVSLTVSNCTVTFSNLSIHAGSVVHVVNATVTVNGTTYTSTFDMDSNWGLSLTAMPLNFFDGFEAYATGSQVSALSAFGWWASSPTVVVDRPATKAPGSTNAVLLPAGQVVSNLVSSGGATKIWTDLYLMETQTMSSVEVVVTNDGPAVVMYLGTNGWLTVFNRDAGGWDVCSNDIFGLAAPRATGSWTRVTWFEDFSGSGTAAFLVDGHVVRQHVPFVGAVTQYHSLRLDTGRDGTARMDSVAITTSLPSGLTYDGDGDGIPDALAIQQYGSVFLGRQGTVYKLR